MHPADLCFKLPDNVSLEEGQCVSPSVLVFMLVGTPKLVLRPTGNGSRTHRSHAFGAPRIVIVDVDGYHLSVAKELSADEIVKVSINMQVRTLNSKMFPFLIKTCRTK